MGRRDPLFDTFDRHLKNPIREDETGEDLIFTVVVEYILHLMEEGNIPQDQMDFLELDLKEEVRDIYKKVTYGYATLKQFRESKNMFEKLRKKTG